MNRPSSKLRKLAPFSLLFIGLSSALAAQAAPDNGWIYELQGKNSGLCIDLTAQSGARQISCNGANSQRFQLSANADGTYSWRAKPGSNKCLTANADGVSIGMAECSNMPSAYQRWTLLPKGDSYSFASAATGKCSVVEGASKASAARIIQYECRGGDNEIFKLGKFDYDAESPEHSGQWSNVIDLGLVPSSVAMLPTNELLYFSGTGTHSFHGNSTVTHVGWFDPATNAWSESTVDTGHEMFCPGLAMTADGRVLIAGGGGKFDRRDVVTSYSPATKEWRAEAYLDVPRWYNSATALPNGKVFTIGGDGDGQPIHSGMEKQGEIWSPTLAVNQRWDRLSSMTEPEQHSGGNYGLARAQYYRHTVLAPSGKLLEMAPSPTLRWLDLSAEGAASVASVRKDSLGTADDSYSQGAFTAQFSQSQVLLGGGALAFGDEDYTKSEVVYTAKSSSYLVDLTSGKASFVASMRYPRYQANGVTLADGTVLAVGGSSVSKLFETSEAVMAPELFDPATNRWYAMAPSAKPRMYHSVAVLMADGRVWVGGGGQCGDNCPANQANAQIYSPPYLFKGQRPLITAAPKKLASNGVQFEVAASSADSTIGRFTLVRMSSVTHSINTDQRLIDLEKVSGADGTFTLKSPASGNIAPAGYYMLFAISAKGVPSAAEIVQITN